MSNAANSPVPVGVDVAKPADPDAPWGGDVTAWLNSRAERPVHEHPDVVDRVHAALAARLADTGI